MNISQRISSEKQQNRAKKKSKFLSKFIFFTMSKQWYKLNLWHHLKRSDTVYLAQSLPVALINCRSNEWEIRVELLLNHFVFNAEN